MRTNQRAFRWTVLIVMQMSDAGSSTHVGDGEPEHNG